MPDRAFGSIGLDEAARSLQIWGFPLIFAQRIRLRFTNPLDPDAARPETSAGAPLNTMGHQRRLSDHTLTAGVAPNVDTLYSLAFLDLDAGPFLLTMPNFGDRYYSVQICESDTTTRIVLGQRTSGPQLPPIRICRGDPSLADGKSETAIKCSTRFVMVAIRVLVLPEDPEDTALARALQEQIQLTGPSMPSRAASESLTDLVRRERNAEIVDPAGFLDSLQHAMTAIAPDSIPSTVVEQVECLQCLVRDTTSVEWRAISDGLNAGLDQIAQHVKTLGETRNGWALNERGADFGGDHLLRAAVAYSQIYIHPAIEALYPVCEVDDQGQQLNGAHAYMITFEPDDYPPAKYFWSLTIYHKAGLLYGNELARYAITDRTPGLVEGADGRLEVWIQTERPHEPERNWLPCPPGDFRLMLRLYGPDQTDWAPPLVTPRVAQ